MKSLSTSKTSKRFAISVLGKDRPGIVAAITKILFEIGGNIEDSSMTLLRDEFVMILLVEFSKNTASDQLAKFFEKTKKEFSLSILTRPLSPSENIKKTNHCQSFIISVYGADQPGIVYTISKTLADHNINITDVQTNKTSSKKPIYVMFLEIELPSKISFETLNAILQKIAEPLNVTVTINPLNASNL